MKNFTSVLWGILLIVFGIVLGGNALSIWDIDIFFEGWWTMFIIIPALVSIARRGFRSANTIWLIVGLGLLVSCWGFFPFSLIWKLAIPGVFVVLGLFVLFGMKQKKQRENYEMYEGNYTTENLGNLSVFCGSSEKRVVNSVYYGGKISAVMGAVVLDLRQAVIESDINIKMDAMMGSIEVFLPQNVQAVVNSSPFLGGVDDKTQGMSGANCPTVFMDCSAVFGGIELKQ